MSPFNPVSLTASADTVKPFLPRRSVWASLACAAAETHQGLVCVDMRCKWRLHARFQRLRVEKRMQNPVTMTCYFDPELKCYFGNTGLNKIYC